MTPSDAEFLRVYLLVAPLILVAFALVVVAITRWQDRREDRRRAEGKPPRWGIDYL